MGRVWGLALGAVALSGCVFIDGDAIDGHFDFGEERGEAIYGAEIKDSQVLVRVPSNGCTEKGHFGFEVENEDDKGFTVEFTRVKADSCKAFVPEGTVLSYSFEELRVPASAELLVLNPLRRN